MIEPTATELAQLQLIADAERRLRRTEVTVDQAGVPVADLAHLHVRGLAWGHDRWRRWCVTDVGRRLLDANTPNNTTTATPSR